MDLISVLLLAVGLAMDAFAVSICKGLAMNNNGIRPAVIIGLWFGVFQGLMPVIGYYLGSSFHDYIASFDYIVAFALLLLIGLNMIRESFSEEDDQDDDIGVRIMFLLAIATSIDALAAGISLAMDGEEIMLSAFIIGVITMAISMFGVKIGGLVGDRLSKKAEILGGSILILIGVKILLEHSGFF